MQIKFIDFPSYFTYNITSKKWKRRSHQPSVKTESTGRLPLISLDSGDIFYLRLLLTNDKCRGVRSETELRTINGVLKPNCMEVCKELGLLQNSDEWDDVLVEASFHLSTESARSTLTYIIMYNKPSNLHQLFENHCDRLSDDWEFITQQHNIYMS